MDKYKPRIGLGVGTEGGKWMQREPQKQRASLQTVDFRTYGELVNLAEERDVSTGPVRGRPWLKH